MKESNFNYKVFDYFVLRTPLLPSCAYRERGETVDTQLFREAIELASPDLLSAMQDADNVAKKGDDKQDNSVLKYLLRACTRCTPFGLFAGCSVGSVADVTNIELSSVDKHKRCTRLDMQYLCALIQHLETVPAIRNQLKFYPNDSLYSIGGKLRYIEYHYINTHRLHEVSAVDLDEYLSTLLAAAKHGATIYELSAKLVSDDISMEDASEFVNDVINNQILKSEIDPSVVGGNVLTTLIAKLSKLDNTPAELAPLKQIALLLDKLNSLPIGTEHNIYEEIISSLKVFGIEYERKYLFQTDLLQSTEKAEVSSKIPDELFKTISFLARISASYQNPTMKAFFEAFYKRYEEREVPLMVALDNELGIGYPSGGNGSGDISPLIDKLYVPGGANNNSSIPATEVDLIILKKLIESAQNNRREIELTDKDFKNFNYNQPLPDTIGVMCSLIKDDGDDFEVFLRSAGGSSAANLLGRFCHLDSSISGLIEDIAKKEEELQPDKLLLEISHLPESRIGNIASRPRFRKHVLHYLSNTDKKLDTDITINDLVLSGKQGQLTLRSKKYNKEVIPHLTCAHNYSMSPIPVYRFLCDFQNQNIRGGVGFFWGNIFSQLAYLPRVKYGNTILSQQVWRIIEADIKPISDNIDNVSAMEKIEAFISERNLVQYVLIPEGDNELFLDLKEIDCWKLLISIIAKRKSISLQEFMYDESHFVVKDAQGNVYTNEMIFAFHKTV